MKVTTTHLLFQNIFQNGPVIICVTVDTVFPSISNWSDLSIRGPKVAKIAGLEFYSPSQPFEVNDPRIIVQCMSYLTIIEYQSNNGVYYDSVDLGLQKVL